MTATCDVIHVTMVAMETNLKYYVTSLNESSKETRYICQILCQSDVLCQW